MKQKILSRGAEATIFLKDNFVIKSRDKKSYRHSQLDKKITKKRTKAEIKILKKAYDLIPTPKVLKDQVEFQIKMEFIEGEKLADTLNNYKKEKQEKILFQIGSSTYKLHKEGIAHSDLTTSNLILKEELVYFIDFGLACLNAKYESKAVDIYLFKQALQAKHFQNYEFLFESFLQGYTSINKSESKKVLERLKAIEKRRRYKH